MNNKLVYKINNIHINLNNIQIIYEIYIDKIGETRFSEVPERYLWGTSEVPLRYLEVPLRYLWGSSKVPTRFVNFIYHFFCIFQILLLYYLYIIKSLLYYSYIIHILFIYYPYIMHILSIYYSYIIDISFIYKYIFNTQRNTQNIICNCYW